MGDEFITRPNPILLEKLLATDNRIRYFPTLNEWHYRLVKLAADPDPIIQGFWLYDSVVFPGLADTIRKEYEGRMPVGLRGITLSICDGFTLPTGLRILSIAEVLLNGCECLDRAVTNVARFEGKDVHHDVKRNLVESSFMLRMHAVPEQRELLFPGVLIYNLTLLKPSTSKALTDSGVLLPVGEERSKVIIGLYILDYLNLKTKLL